MVDELGRVLEESARLVDDDRDAPAAQQIQRITANDIAVGQIRFPRPAKEIFPTQPGKVEVDLLGIRRQTH